MRILKALLVLCIHRSTAYYSAAQFKAAVNVIRDDVAKLSPEDSRQLAINALLKSAENDMDRLDPASNSTLGQVNDLLDLVLQELLNATVAMQAWVDDHKVALSNCNTQQQSQLDDARNATLESENNHTVCRDIEASHWNASEDACLLLFAYLNGLSFECTKPTTDTVNNTLGWVIRHWEYFFNEGYDDFFAMQNDYPPLRDACSAAQGTWQGTQSDCNALQRDWEVHVCYEESTTDVICQGRATCRSSLISTDQAIWDAIPGNNEIRRKEVAMIIHIRCMVSELMKGNADENTRSLCPLTPWEDSSLDPYEVVTGSQPAEANCTYDYLNGIYPDGAGNQWQTYLTNLFDANWPLIMYDQTAYQCTVPR